MKFDGQYAYEITEKLSYPRMVGSNGNRRAVDDIEERMRSIGLDATRDDFSASTFPMGVMARWVMLIISTPLLIGAWALRSGHPAWGLFMGTLTAAIAFKAVGMANSFKAYYKYGKQYPAQNITGKLPGGGDKGDVVLMAHFDTKSQPFPIEYRILSYLAAGVGTIVCLAWIVAGSAGALAGIWAGGGKALSVVAIITACVSGALVFNAVENNSVGSLDNAAGVGVILGLAKAWVAHPPEGLSLTVVATNAEEWGLQGAEQWMDDHASDYAPRKTIFLNYDGPGSKAGRIIATTTFGLPKREIAGPRLKADFEAACAELGLKNVKDIYIPFGANTDMMPVSNAGFNVLNIGSLSRGVHTSRDNMDIIDAGELQKAGDIGSKVIEKFGIRNNSGTVAIC